MSDAPPPSSLASSSAHRSELKARVMAGSLTPEAAVINAEVLPEVFILHAAARVALQAARRGTLKTRSLHAELVFSIAGSKHVSYYWYDAVSFL